MAEATRRFSVRGVLRHLLRRLGLLAVEEPDRGAFEGETAPLPPIEGRIAAVEAPDQASFRGKKYRRMPGRDPATLVAREIWPPDGRPPPTVPTPHAIKKLSAVMKDRVIPVPHDDTLRAAINRRDRH